jgi:hypothetical protein
MQLPTIRRKTWLLWLGLMERFVGFVLLFHYIETSLQIATCILTRVRHCTRVKRFSKCILTRVRRVSDIEVINITFWHVYLHTCIRFDTCIQIHVSNRFDTCIEVHVSNGLPRVFAIFVSKRFDTCILIHVSNRFFSKKKFQIEFFI